MAHPEAGDKGTTEETQTRRPTGMKGFTIIWFGQLVSLLGTGMRARKGLLGTLPGLVGYAFDAVRNIEDIIPDHDADTPTTHV